MQFRLCLAVALTLVALPLVAQSNEVGVWYATSRLDKTRQQDGQIEFKDGSGFAVSVNHFWTSHIATELAWASTKNEGTLSLGGTTVLSLGDLKMKTLSATVQWHFASQAMLDPYLGAGFARISARNLSSADLTAADIGVVTIARSNTWVANGGISVNVTPHLGVGVDAKYARYRPHARTADTDSRLDINPLFVAVGARIRF